MPLEFSICEVKWDRYPRVSGNAHAREWLEFQATRGLAANTIEAYGRDLDSYLGFLRREIFRSTRSFVRRSELTFKASLCWRAEGSEKGDGSKNHSRKCHSATTPHCGSPLS